MLLVKPGVSIDEDAIKISQIRSSGPGGQNVNKVASAVELRLDITRSGLSYAQQQRLKNYSDQRITAQAEVVIKAQMHRTYQLNLDDAKKRLVELVAKALHQNKKRKKTKPTKASVRRRLDKKSQRSSKKALRSKVL
ncbi:alternative ribosome rescue aminoacyl-tRNA hydrolase ArfB [Celerinatantimonas diazotrophica]|uniref:Ribosome-associated protein n=1 Tax=Celerinatantimonas diazotrophica TaxID=412034 RepID=A0A4R1KFF0_9GAMM|nr:alternative ribosome rescue aminoacyl-tRNA hydrolase ArfB [Celerinatantimonas diazotrophica]TCK63372.1 ribosome-associated protein [Celerinatantimonas diazotrophica]CAG9294916.1 Peptidyl-tRNA hydrolase ArfB [Celerinatantimonas diazotrophica]